MINAENGYHLWSERYDREMADVFAMQDEIAGAIATALQVKLSPAAPLRRYTPKVPAYEALLKARHTLSKFTPESMARSREYFEQAVALDPQYALAHNELATYFLFLAVGGIMPAHAAMPQVREAARRALDIDPSLPEAHAMLGVVAGLYDYDWRQADRHFRLAVNHEPLSAFVRSVWAMYYLVPMRRHGDALQELQRALEEDPLHLPTRHAKATCLLLMGRLEESEAELRQILELDETFSAAWGILASACALQGRVAEALEHAEKSLALAAFLPMHVGVGAAMLMNLGEENRAQEILSRLGDGSAYGAPIGFTVFHFHRGEPDKACDWAAKAIEQRYPLVPGMLSGAIGTALKRTPLWPSLAKQLARISHRF